MENTITITPRSSLLTVLKSGIHLVPAYDGGKSWRLRMSTTGKRAIVAEALRQDGYYGQYLYYRRFPLTIEGVRQAIDFLRAPTLPEDTA